MISAKARYYANYIWVICCALYVGWQANNGYHYVERTLAKAAVCDKMPGGCQEIMELASVMQEPLPLAKSLKSLENKNRITDKK